MISYLRIKSYNALNYNNCSTDWSFPLKPLSTNFSYIGAVSFVDGITLRIRKKTQTSRKSLNTLSHNVASNEHRPSGIRTHNVRILY